MSRRRNRARELDRYQYHAALTDLERATRAWAEAIVNVAQKAQALQGEPDDPLAIRVMVICNALLVHAFARAPGMVQVLSGGPMPMRPPQIEAP